MEVLSDKFLGYLWQMCQGAMITLELFASGFTLALLLGTAIGIITLSKNPIIQIVWKVYASVIMGVPSLLIIFLLYYGGSAMLTGIFGSDRSFDVTPFGAGLTALTIVYACYVAELVHGAVTNLPKGQFEACKALAIRPVGAWRHVIMPQLIRLALPGLVNVWITVLKDTPLVSLAGLNDLVANAKIAAGATKEPFAFFIAASLFFIAFSALTLRLSERVEARFNRGMAQVKT